MVDLNWKNKSKFARAKIDFPKEFSIKIFEYFDGKFSRKYKTLKKTQENNNCDEISLLNKDKWINLLFWGDNKVLLKYLIKKFKERVRLIYIDPPFATGGDFNYKILIGNEERKKIESISTKAYSDSWKNGIESYLNFLYERLVLIKELLAEDGSIYIHLDWHISHYVKVILDEIFGEGNFRNEIIWAYPAASAKTRNFFIRSYDTLLFYTKSDEYVFNDDPRIYMEYSDRVKNALKEDEKGLFYYRGGSHDGKKLSRKVYVKNKGIFPRDVWNDIPYIRANTLEYQGFSTQKPERLLKRIILASSNEEDVIADFFCGSGTTLAAAEKLNRRWIGCDINFHSIHISKKRLLTLNTTKDLTNKKRIYKKPVKSFAIMSTKEYLEKAINIDRELFKNSGEDSNDQKIENNLEIIVKAKKKDKHVAVELVNYKNPYDSMLKDNVIGKIKTWNEFIDFWSIDYNFNEKYMHNIWYSLRIPKDRQLELTSQPYEFKDAGKYTLKVKVIDIFGNTAYKILNISIS
ncbi:MAG: hypothetical protein GF353_13880 [Candidatus Lokiarchaeota archaeon]|nr:hypothetical protein [Candidatus Lokiarchaeota archaeon]